jgi:GNAT superfamily N-acetyltransferase
MVRKALIADVPQVASLYHSVWHETQAAFWPRAECLRRSPEFFIERMTRMVPTTLVGEYQAAVVALAAWEEDHLLSFYFAKAHRGTGMAEALLAATEEAMRKEGTTEAKLDCGIGNSRARRFYERMGWVYRNDISKLVLNGSAEIGVPFWRMTKSL